LFGADCHSIPLFAAAARTRVNDLETFAAVHDARWFHGRTTTAVAITGTQPINVE
jgi:acetylornithine/succinyldiaminopimelate/putrescine aminotransferase